MNHIETLRAALIEIYRLSKRWEIERIVEVALAATAEPAQSTEMEAKWKSHYEEACEAYNYKTKECDDLTEQLAAMTVQGDALAKDAARWRHIVKPHDPIMREAYNASFDAGIAAIAATKGDTP